MKMTFCERRKGEDEEGRGGENHQQHCTVFTFAFDLSKEKTMQKS